MQKIKTKKASEYPSEFSEQCAVIQWSMYRRRKYSQLKFLHCSLNGVRLTPAQSKKMKASGMVAGVADLFLPAKSFDGQFCGLYIEMKKRKGGVISADQQIFADFVLAQGYEHKFCFGADQAIKLIKNYLGMEDFT